MTTPDDDKQIRASKLSKIFNYIGGTLIFFGITYLLFNNWFVLASFFRIVITLGVACVSILTAVSLSRSGNSPASSAVFYLLGGMLLPLGLSVTLEAFGLDNSWDIEYILITAICFSVYLVLQLRFPRDILLLFCVIFASFFFVAITNYLNHNIWFMTNLLDYQMFVLGLGYLLLGYKVSTESNSLTGPLYFFGDLFVLLASFHLGGLLFDDKTYLFWELVSPLLVLLSFVLAIPLKSKSLLYLGAIFLMIYIPSLTSKFAHLFGALGWPVLLIGAGVLLMLLGYFIVHMDRKIPRE
jgi:hypothetical protein